MSATERTVKELKWAKERLRIKDDEINELKVKLENMENTFIVVALLLMAIATAVGFYLAYQGS